MRDQQINTFNKGMMQDLGKSIPQEGFYLNAENVRIIANENDSESGILVNVDGNEHSFEVNAPCGEMAPCQQGWVEGGQLVFTEGMSIEEGQFIVVEGIIHYIHTSADNVSLADLTECPPPPPPVILGCMDPAATNYNPNATIDDGSCIPEPVYGCTDPDALNYDPNATVNQVGENDPTNPCEYPKQGCMDPENYLYDPEATFQEEGDCLCVCGPYNAKRMHLAYLNSYGGASATYVFTNYGQGLYFISNRGYITGSNMSAADAYGLEELGFWDTEGINGPQCVNINITELEEHIDILGNTTSNPNNEILENYRNPLTGNMFQADAAYIGDHPNYDQLQCRCEDDNSINVQYWFHPNTFEDIMPRPSAAFGSTGAKINIEGGEYVETSANTEFCSKYSVPCGEAIPTNERVISAEEYLLSYFTGTNSSMISINITPTQEEIDSVNDVCPVQVIGWTAIRDDLYLFATNNESFNPGGVLNDPEIDPPSAGYIFKVTFDLTTNEATDVALIYAHSELNFSTKHPIEAVGRFETNSVQRLYWTDNYNEVRTINVMEENIFHLVPEDLKLIPFSFFSVPVITGVKDGGELPAGMYQFAYRLKNEGGAETRFSAFTGLAHIVEASEDENYWTYSDDPENVTEYVGTAPGVMCEKSILLKIDNIDTSFDKIEIACIYRTTQEGISSSYIFESKKINSESMTFVHNSHTDIVGLISLIELTAFSLNIERAKTIETKDNRLFLGNVITPELKPFDRFNARAYRFRRQDRSAWAGDDGHPTETYVDFDFDPKADYVQDINQYNNQGFTYTLKENLDAINPFNIMLQSPEEPDDRYKYQSDGKTIGGEGPNVKYEFIKKELDGDIYVAGDKPSAAPYVSVKPLKKDCITVEEYLDYKNPEVAANYKGYQRDEIYRFGLVLYDKQGNPGSVNWIGDIRFPHYRDFDWKGGASLYNFSLSQTRATDGTVRVNPFGSYVHTQTWAEGLPYYLTGSQSGLQIEQDQNGFLSLQEQYSPGTVIAGEGDEGGLGYGEDIEAAYGQYGYAFGINTRVDKHSMWALGIKFSIQLPPDVVSEISGYSIVRVERTQSDKTVLGTGIGHWMHSFASKKSGTDEANDATRRVAHNGRMATFDDAPEWVDTKFGQMQHNCMTFDSPDFLLTGNYPSLSACDYIEHIGSLNTGGSRNAVGNDFVAGQTDNFYRKFYAHTLLNWPKILSTAGGAQGIIGNFFDIGNHNWSTFIQPESVHKLTEGGKLSSSVLDINAPIGVENASIIVNGDGADIDYYGVGCETLFLKFPNTLYHPITGNTINLAQGNLATGGLAQATNGYIANYFYWHDSLLATEWYLALSEGKNVMAPDKQFYHDDDGQPHGFSEDASAAGQINKWTEFGVFETPYFAWRRQLYDQYGGNTYEDRQKNVYVSTGTFVGITQDLLTNLEETEIDVWGGDIYVHFYDYTKMKKYQGDNNISPDIDYSTSGSLEKMNWNYAFPVESTLNLGLREGYHFANKTSNMLGDESDDQPLDDPARLIRPMYSAINDLIEFYPQKDYLEKEGQYDNRVLYSEEKYTGNARDSWRKFKPENYRDVDGGYGPINKLINFKDQLFFFQDRGTGLFSVNPVAMTTTTDQISLVLGTGAVLQDHNYVAVDIGSKHQWSVLATNQALYWADILTNSIYRISMGKGGIAELSRVKGMKSYFESRLEGSEMSATKYDNLYGSIKEFGDTPTFGHGIIAGYDSKNNEVLFSFLERDFSLEDSLNGTTPLKTSSKVLCYSETTQSFTSFYSFATHMFINMQDKLLSVNPYLNKDFYLHNTGSIASWYGTTFDTTVKFITNKNPLDTKVFDSYEWHTEAIEGLEAEPNPYNSNIPDITWDVVECQNDHQNNGRTLVAINEEDPLLINIKRRERTWKTSIVRAIDKTRFRDKYLVTKLVFKNSSHNNIKLRTHYVKTKFRVSRR